MPGIDEGYYLRLCQLTGGIHEQLDAVKVEGAPKRRTGFAYDDDDLLSGTWTVRRVRRLYVVVTRSSWTSAAPCRPRWWPDVQVDWCRKSTRC